MKSSENKDEKLINAYLALESLRSIWANMPTSQT